MPSSTLYLVKAWESQEETKTFWQRMREQLFASALGLTEKGLNETIQNRSNELEILYNKTFSAGDSNLFNSENTKAKNIFKASFETAFIGSRFNLIKLPFIFIFLVIELIASFFREGALSLNIGWDQLKENHQMIWAVGKILFFMPIQLLANIFAYFLHTINRPKDSVANYKSVLVGTTLTTSIIALLATQTALLDSVILVVTGITLSTGVVAIGLGILAYTLSFFGQSAGLCQEIYAWHNPLPPPVFIKNSDSPQTMSTPTKKSSPSSIANSPSTTPAWSTSPHQIKENTIEYIYQKGVEATDKVVAGIYFRQIYDLCEEPHLKTTLEALLKSIATANLPATWQEFIDANQQTTAVVLSK